MGNILIVEDDPADMRRAKAALAALNLGEISGATSVAEAFRYLDGVREGKHGAPALIVLDLSLGYESGFEILRSWKSDRNFAGIQIVIWTQMGEREQELCRLFGLKHIISKFSDVSDLQNAVKNAFGPASRPAK